MFGYRYLIKWCLRAVRRRRRNSDASTPLTISTRPQVCIFSYRYCQFLIYLILFISVRLPGSRRNRPRPTCLISVKKYFCTGTAHTGTGIQLFKCRHGTVFLKITYGTTACTMRAMSLYLSNIKHTFFLLLTVSGVILREASFVKITLEGFWR
jgi:hypothetical protein